MSSRLIISIDDYGLSRHNVDTILDAVDKGNVTSVSILANGDAVDYAVHEYAKRASHLDIALHLNLTEGMAISKEVAVRALTNEEGMFRYSVGKLFLTYFFSSSHKRLAFRSAVRVEVGAQIQRVRSLLVSYGHDIAGIDGHQHVHMIPFIFDALVAEKPSYIRITSEPWYFVPKEINALWNIHAWARPFLGFLSVRNRHIAKENGIITPAFFLGFVFSGRMTLPSFEEGLHAISTRGVMAGVSEACFHPGSTLSTELGTWTNANRNWYCSPLRVREHELLKSDAFHDLCTNFRAGTLTQNHWYQHLSKIIRFGISGGIAAFTQLILLYVFVEYFHIWYVFSNILAFGFSFGVSFFLQKFWTFQNASERDVSRQVGLYLILQFSSLVINSFLLSVLVEWVGIAYLPAEFCILILVAFVTFFVSHRFIFN